RRLHGTAGIGVLWSTANLRSTILRQPGRGLGSGSRPHAEPAYVDVSLRRSRGTALGPHPHASAGLPRSACRSKEGPSDTHPPHLGSRLDGVPGELTSVLSFELVTERFGIVVVDEHIASFGGEAVVRGEDRLVALCRRQMAHVELTIRGSAAALLRRVGCDRLTGHQPHEPVQACRGPDGE